MKVQEEILGKQLLRPSAKYTGTLKQVDPGYLTTCGQM